MSMSAKMNVSEIDKDDAADTNPSLNRSLSANSGKRCHVLIPAYNEERIIATTVEALSSLAGQPDIWVIDDGSKDATAELAQRAGANVCSSQRRLGKGAALTLGIERLTAAIADGGEAGGSNPSVNGGRSSASSRVASASDIVLLIDADLGASAAKVGPLIEAIAQGQADLAIAVLPSPPDTGGFGLVKSLGKRAIRNLGGGFESRAPLSGQRALTLDTMRQLMPLADGYGVEVVMTIRALQAGMRVLELPMALRHRFTGRDLAGFLHRGRQYLDLRAALRQMGKG
ncbi:MAG: glycosyltransferase family 2 protein [Actinomycetia bacterium]|nr:glycosyltransferase family 2 protein [Actinomycetes bacterium]